MKKLFVSLGSALLLLSSASAFSANVCAAGVCYFGSLDRPSKHVDFHCRASDNTTKVRMQNHNINITGFNSEGDLKLDGEWQVGRLKYFYFRATVDPDKVSSRTKSITYSANGHIECKMGKGDRKMPFYLLFTL